MTSPIIELIDVHKHYKQGRSRLFEGKSHVKAVDGVNLTIYEGESFGLVSESGSGKSTLGEVILQLLKQTSGTVKYKGIDVTSLSKKERKSWRKKVQIIFQNPYASLNPKKTVGWIVEEPLKIHHLGDKLSRQQKVKETLEEVGLDPSFMDRYPHELSGGQRQRVAIASAIILEPEFLVIDEGVSALDVSVQAQILNLLKKLQRKYQLTYLFISHDLNVVQYFCDRIAVMYLGEIMEIGKAEELGKVQKHPYSEGLFSSILTINLEGERIVLEGDLPNPTNPPQGCPFHTRCTYAMERCKTEKPMKHILSKDHIVHCHLYEKKEVMQNVN